MKDQEEITKYIEDNLYNETTVYFTYAKANGEASQRQVALEPPEADNDKKYKPGVNFYGRELPLGQIKLWRFDRVVELGFKVKTPTTEAAKQAMEDLKQFKNRKTRP